ncbi:hypothetical protein Ciccas_001516 [Cichlidogyrus casuarinus]|uniref:Uncharacterized protein n=1 Tax=Cichlidogyrus casuarinus TaxID=1844966 RepID=A0ABD2QM63_9PLAT
MKACFLLSFFALAFVQGVIGHYGHEFFDYGTTFSHTPQFQSTQVVPGATFPSVPTVLPSFTSTNVPMNLNNMVDLLGNTLATPRSTIPQVSQTSVMPQTLPVQTTTTSNTMLWQTVPTTYQQPVSYSYTPTPTYDSYNYGYYSPPPKQNYNSYNQPTVIVIGDDDLYDLPGDFLNRIHLKRRKGRFPPKRFGPMF